MKMYRFIVILVAALMLVFGTTACQDEVSEPPADFDLQVDGVAVPPLRPPPSPSSGPMNRSDSLNANTDQPVDTPGELQPVRFDPNS